MLTRAEIIDSTGLNPASVSHALRYLLDRGVVLRLGAMGSNGGRRREILTLNGEAGCLVSVDLEGTRIRFAVTNLLGDIRYRWEHKLRYGQRLGIKNILYGIEMALSNLDREQMSRVLAVGVSYPGLMDSEGTLTAVNLGWNKFPLIRELRRAVPHPVFFQANGHTCIEAEISHGWAKNCQNFIFVIMENGVGTGICIDGRSIHAQGFKRGELGHCTIEPDAFDLCRCGKRGCLEAIASSPNVVRQYREKIGESRELPPDLSVTDVYQEARSSDPVAIAVLNRVGRALGFGLSHLVNLLSPELIILGGDLISGSDLLLPVIREELSNHALPDLLDNLKITPSKLGLDIRLKGAASFAFREAVADSELLEKLCNSCAVGSQNQIRAAEGGSTKRR